MNILGIDKQVQATTSTLPDYNYMLGRTLLMPFRPANSGSRALMHVIHSEHHMPLENAEVPLVQTGYETEFGRCSTSHIVADADYRVIMRIDKFTFNKNHYFLILQNMENGVYDMIERVSYRHNTESYGYLWNNTKLDELADNIGSIVPRGTVLKMSRGFDEYGNKKNGVNLITLYVSSAQNMEKQYSQHNQ